LGNWHERLEFLRTALSPDGIAVKRNGKTFRMTLDPIADGAVKLDPDEDVTQGVCIAEGVEMALAGRQMGLRPVWALLGESGLASFPVLLASMDFTFSASTMPPTNAPQWRAPDAGTRPGETFLTYPDWERP